MKKIQKTDEGLGNMILQQYFKNPEMNSEFYTEALNDISLKPLKICLKIKKKKKTIWMRVSW
jgi:hypothetical protein